jgi:hypothetical protein
MFSGTSRHRAHAQGAWTGVGYWRYSFASNTTTRTVTSTGDYVDVR